MKISQIDSTNFMASTFQLQRVNAKKIKSLEAIKKIAEDKNVDIFILKNGASMNSSTEDMYMVMASTDVSAIGKKNPRHKIEQSKNCMIVSKKIPKEELSVRIYNAAVSAIEALENKILTV